KKKLHEVGPRGQGGATFGERSSAMDSVLRTQYTVHSSRYQTLCTVYWFPSRSPVELSIGQDRAWLTAYHNSVMRNGLRSRPTAPAWSRCGAGSACGRPVHSKIGSPGRRCRNRWNVVALSS